MIKKIQLVTLGCSKNRVDSEHLLNQVFNNRVEILPESGDLAKLRPDAIILNTCGFIADAKEESIEAILNAVEAKKAGYTKKVIAFGCLSQRYAKELSAEIPELDGIYGAFELDSVLNAIGGKWDSNYNNHRYLTTPSHYAYLKISEGCDRICSYCSIPLIRGKHNSVNPKDLVEEATILAQKGVKELILVAQDTTYYGIDLTGKRELAGLIEQLSEIEGIEWIRLLYSYPTSFPEELLEVMANNPKVCKYIDIPLQHINDQVLSNMRRGIDSKTTRSLVSSFREKVPGVVLRTTFIVGHPGESPEAFEELKEFLKEAKFERVGAFTYSPEEGTWGDENLKDSISQQEKERRYEELMELQAEISDTYNQSRIGTTERVLVERIEGDFLIARSMYEAPEVDGEILIERNELSVEECKNFIGTFVNVEITYGDQYDLIAKLID